MKKSRIFITGDVHNTVDVKKFNIKNFPIQKDLTKGDYVIILGDFGFPWHHPESKEDSYWLNWFDNKNFTTIYLDGNHENFDALKTYPIVDFLNAKCHKIRENIYHVLRGEVLEINNKKFLCIGGAISIDKAYRKEGISWWPEENPTYREWKNAFQNLAKADLILSHDGPYKITKKILNIEKNTVNHMFDRLFENQNHITNWYFGHHHVNKTLIVNNVVFNILYNNIIELSI